MEEVGGGGEGRGGDDMMEPVVVRGLLTYHYDAADIDYVSTQSRTSSIATSPIPSTTRTIHPSRPHSSSTHKAHVASMARRKKDYLSDGSSESGVSEPADEGYDSQEDPDARAERVLFEHGGRRKKRRMGDGKSAAWEGIFGEDEEEPDRRDSRGGRAGGPSRGSAKFT
jgi:hypothetical protein